MRLTVSSTAMMKPLLQCNDANQTTSPPIRILGLLERQHACQPGINSGHRVVQYHRPHQHQPYLQTAQWEHFLRINNATDQAFVAVFGYEFDGTRSWYRIWNRQTRRSCWVCHQDGMTYQPYAIVAMDALVSLVPNWNGQLHKAPNSKAPHKQTQYKKVQKKKNPADRTHNNTPCDDGTDRHCTVMVSDASTDTHGGLWFLVTVDPANDCATETHKTLTGWISSTQVS